jgi:hypothetical protein
MPMPTSEVESIAAVARRMSYSGGVAAAAIAAVAVVGCSVPQSGQLSAKAGGAAGTVEVDEPVRPEGPVRAQLPSGDLCSGTFTQVNVAELESLGAPQSPIRTNDVATLATLTCARGGALRCTMARTAGGAFSFGECKDADGNEYRLRF